MPLLPNSRLITPAFECEQVIQCPTNSRTLHYSEYTKCSEITAFCSDMYTLGIFIFQCDGKLLFSAERVMPCYLFCGQTNKCTSWPVPTPHHLLPPTLTTLCSLALFSLKSVTKSDFQHNSLNSQYTMHPSFHLFPWLLEDRIALWEMYFVRNWSFH